MLDTLLRQLTPTAFVLGELPRAPQRLAQLADFGLTRQAAPSTTRDAV